MASAEISARATRFWKRLTEWYGVRMTEAYGDTPPADWCRLVDRSSNADMRRALATIRNKHATHPPTLPEFEAALRPPAPAHRGSNQPTTQERLTAHVAASCTMTPAQMRSAWTWLFRRVQWTDAQGRHRDEPAECVGVEIPTIGEAAGFRVMADEMAA